MKIYLIRHGQTTGDVEDRYGGEYEDHLSPEGIKQVRQLANSLKNKNIEIIFHSSRIRATETAQIVSEILNVKTIKNNDIKERNAYGILTGMKKTEAKEKYPKEVEKLKSVPCQGITNSEDYDLFKKRILKGFEEIFNQNYQTIAVISHGGPISGFVREYLNLGEFEFMGDCAVFELEKTNKNITLTNITNAKLKKI